MESSPCPVFLLAVIDEGAVPAVGAADGGDDLLIFGRDKAEAFQGRRSIVLTKIDLFKIIL